MRGGSLGGRISPRGLFAAVNRLHDLLTRLAQLMQDVAGWLFVLTAVVITFDVLARRAVGISVQGVTELTGYALAIGLTWGLAPTLMSGGHIRVDVLVMKTPLRIRQFLHLAAITALSVFAFVLARRSWDVVSESWLFGSTDSTILKLPLVIPQALWAFGITMFCIAAVVSSIRASLLIVLGDAAAVDAQLRVRGALESDDAPVGLPG